MHATAYRGVSGSKIGGIVDRFATRLGSRLQMRATNNEPGACSLSRFEWRAVRENLLSQSPDCPYIVPQVSAGSDTQPTQDWTKNLFVTTKFQNWLLAAQRVILDMSMYSAAVANYVVN